VVDEVVVVVLGAVGFTVVVVDGVAGVVVFVVVVSGVGVVGVVVFVVVVSGVGVVGVGDGGGSFFPRVAVVMPPVGSFAVSSTGLATAKC